MRRSPLVFVLLLSVLLLGTLSSMSQAQCVTCSGAHCVFVTNGHGSCTEIPNNEFPCKLACPNCPTAPCDGGGGGGGGGCFLFDPAAARAEVAPNRSVVTAGLLFRSDASTNAKIFGGRGHGYRVLQGGALGDLTADGAARAIADLVPGAAAQLALSNGFTNVNNAGIPVSFVTPDGEGFGFAPGSSGFGAHMQVKVRGMTKLTRAVADVPLASQDLLLVDVSVHGKAYILVLKSDVLDAAAPDSETRLRNIEDSLRNGYRLFPQFDDNPPLEMC